MPREQRRIAAAAEAAVRPAIDRPRACEPHETHASPETADPGGPGHQGRHEYRGCRRTAPDGSRRTERVDRPAGQRGNRPDLPVRLPGCAAHTDPAGTGRRGSPASIRPGRCRSARPPGRRSSPADAVPNHIGAVIKANSTAELPLDEITLPEMLDRERHRTGLRPRSASGTSGPWRSASGTRHPVLQGFDVFEGSMNNTRCRHDGRRPTNERSYAAWERVGPTGRPTVDTTFSTTRIVDDAIAVLGDLPEPWFLYVAFHAAHKPLMVPPAELTGDSRWSILRTSAPSTPPTWSPRTTSIGRLIEALGDRRVEHADRWPSETTGLPAGARRTTTARTAARAASSRAACACRSSSPVRR